MAQVIVGDSLHDEARRVFDFGDGGRREIFEAGFAKVLRNDAIGVAPAAFFDEVWRMTVRTEGWFSRDTHRAIISAFVMF